MPRSVAIMAFGTVLLLTQSASASLSLLEWSADWSGFRDDFEDGDFADGSSGETRLYTQICGVVTDAEEDAGRLRFQGPQAPCNGVAVRARMPALANPRGTIQFAPQTFPSGSSAGMEVATQDGSHSVMLFFSRHPAPGPVTDTLTVDLYVDGVNVAAAALAASAPSILALSPVVDLEFSGVAEPGGAQWRPRGRYRVCMPPSCLDSTPWSDLYPNPSLAPGQGLVPMNAVYEPYLFAQGGAAFVVDLTEWTWATSFTDDFESDAFASALPYYANCPSAVVDGAFVLAPPVGWTCNAGLPAFVTGEASARATFAWSMPRPCSYGAALQWGTDPSSFASDTAVASVGRASLPGIGSDVLFVGLWSEAGPSGPFALLVLSSNAAADPALAGVAAIELALAIERDGALLRPHGRARLCDTIPCPSESLKPLRELTAYAVPQIQGADVCGIPVVAWSAPPDGGAMTAVPHAIGVFYAPEPDAAAFGSLALATLAIMARIRRNAR